MYAPKERVFFFPYLHHFINIIFNLILFLVIYLPELGSGQLGAVDEDLVVIFDKFLVYQFLKIVVEQKVLSLIIHQIS